MRKEGDFNWGMVVDGRQAISETADLMALISELTAH